MTARQTNVHRALLESLQLVPAGYLLPESVLRSDAARLVVPAAVTSELDTEITRADRLRRITTVPTETGNKYQLAPAGVAWLAENP